MVGGEFRVRGGVRAGVGLGVGKGWRSGCDYVFGKKQVHNDNSVL